MKREMHKPYNRLKVWLKDNNITYADLGRLLGRSETAISFKINGRSDFLLAEIQIIKRTYGIDDNIFFTDDVA